MIPSQQYYKFLKCCVNELLPISKEIDNMDWGNMYAFSTEQIIPGIVFTGVERLGKEGVIIPRELLFKWIADIGQIKQRNLLLNQRCIELTEKIRKDGFECCILKGQGNATVYPNPYSRTPGDIDVWVMSKSDVRCKKDDVIKYAKLQNPKAEVRIYHVEYEWKGVPVELHFMPGIMNNPFYNRRLQHWYRNKADKGCHIEEIDLPDGIGKIPVPTNEFNIVFQLAHMMHHYFDEGIGLRQMIDYYYLLRNVKDEVRCKKEDVIETLKYLNLYKFAGAVMYIMKEVLGLDEQYLIVPVDERRGKTLLKEILKGGNFGQYSGLTQKSMAKKYFAKTWRNLRFVREYPAEALCEPLFRTWHFFWRRMNG